MPGPGGDWKALGVTTEGLGVTFWDVGTVCGGGYIIAFVQTLRIIHFLGHLGGSVSKRPTLAQVMISWFMSSSPALGSALTFSLSDSLPLSLSLSLKIKK